MKLALFKQLWGHAGSLADAIDDVTAAGFQGIEGPPPEPRAGRADFRARLDDAGLEFMAEITTGIRTPGVWVPAPGLTVEDHLRDFRTILDRALEMRPFAVTCMGGSDLWTFSESVHFLTSAYLLASETGVRVAYETHRSRSLFHPRITAELLAELPDDLELTCDFSHWCVVTERLVLDEMPDILALAASRARHVHARVGYDQGPQVPDPRAPEHAGALAAHERWWDAIWKAQEERGFDTVSMTPESGPDGYLQCAPFTREPVADLWDINRWIGHRQRERLADLAAIA